MASSELTRSSEENQPRSVARTNKASPRANYVLIRGTGLVLVVLALGHFSLTHIITDVAETDASFIDRRWANIGWVLWDASLLIATLAHAGAGLGAVIRDYAPGRARGVYIIVLGVLSAFLVLGIATLVLHQVNS